MLATNAEGKDIRTIEGVANGDEPIPCNRAFLDQQTFQCGLIRRNDYGDQGAAKQQSSAPTEVEVRDYYWVNICRCGTYQEVMAAIKSLAERNLTSKVGGSTIPFQVAATQKFNQGGRDMIQLRFWLLITIFLGFPFSLSAQTRFIHAYSVPSSAQWAIWAAKDLVIFTKYGLDADLVFISGSARGTQALLGGSVQAADSDGVGRSTRFCVAVIW